MERRIAKERRGGRKLRRVKRSAKYGQSQWGNGVPVQIAFYAFGMCALLGVTVYRTFHRSGPPGSGPGASPHQAVFHRKFDPRAGETNSDGGSFMSRLRGRFDKYIIPESMKKIGNKAKWYGELRKEWDTHILPKDDGRSIMAVTAIRERQGIYTQAPGAQTPYDIHDCPDYPPEGYPMQWPVLDVLENWPTDDPRPEKHTEIYQGLCVFDYRTDMQKMKNYRHAELAFVVRNDPAAARTAERWNHPEYMEQLLMGKEDTMRRTEYSPNNHFMYWVDKRPKQERREAAKRIKERRRNGEDIHGGFGRGDQEQMADAMRDLERVNVLKKKLDEAKEYLEDHEDDDDAEAEVENLQYQLNEAKKMKSHGAMEDWQPPTEMMRMTYLNWLEHANVTDDKLGPDNPHWYFRLIGCGKMGEHTEDGSCDKGSSEWLFDELTFFQPRLGDEKSFYLVEPKHQKGIHCRFGMKGVIAENHFDLSRNAIALLGGQRRYILAHPSQCNNMNLLPRGHPSARHSAVDWSDPDLEAFPTFAKAHVNEVVMQPGDVLYLPTNWFHYIVSLELNMQCNTRSGGETIYREEIRECGF